MLKSWFSLPTTVSFMRSTHEDDNAFNFPMVALFLVFGILAGTAYGQGSLQGLVRISGNNGNIVSISAGAPAATYILTLPPNTNPSTTAASVLFGTGSGLLDWTPAAASDSGYVIQLVDVGGGMFKPRWVDPSLFSITDNFWLLDGNALSSAYNGTSGNFLGTTNSTPLILATTNTLSPQPIEFFTNNTERMRIAPTGELGIGVTPGAGVLLHVGGTAGTSNVRFNSLSGANLPLVFGANEGLLIADANGNLTKRDPGILLQNFVQYDISSPQGQSVTRSNYLFNVGYNGAADDAHATGASITSVGGLTNRNATGLTIDATATGVGTATGLAVAATGGAINNAVDATGNIRILSAGGTANRLSLQNPAGTFATTLSAGVQSANINYTLPVAAPAVNGYILSSTTAGTMSWLDPATLTGNYWTLSGNATTTAWNGTTGNFLGTTTTQPLVLGTQGAQPIRFYSNNTEKMSLLSSGELGIGTTPTAARLLHVAGTAGTANIRFNSLSGSVLPMSVSANDGILFADANGDITKRDPDILTRNYVQYEIDTPQAQALTRTEYLYNVAYSGSANDANAAGAVITSTGGATNRNASGLQVTSTATGTGTATGLSVTATGGATRNAVDATGAVRLLASSGVASPVEFQNPAGTATTTIRAGAQSANITYTLPTIQAPAAGRILSNDGAGNLSWVDLTSTTVDYARNQFDDFVMSTLDQSGSGAADHTEFSYTFENAQVEGDATANDYIGRMYLTTTGTGSSADAWVSTFGGDNKIMLGGKIVIFETRSRIETLSTSSQRLVFYTGLMSSNSIGEPTNGVYFKYSDNLNSGQWQCISRNSSTSTTVNTSISVVADQWYILRCVISPGSPNLVEYYIDNALVGTSTTNIPTAAIRYVIKMEKTIGSSDRTASTDWLLTKMIR